MTKFGENLIETIKNFENWNNYLKLPLLRKKLNFVTCCLLQYAIYQYVQIYCYDILVKQPFRIFTFGIVKIYDIHYSITFFTFII